MSPKERRRGEAGFTLIELVVSIAILGIVGAVLTGAVILGLRTTQGAADRMSSVVAAQTLGSVFGSDVQGAAQVSTTDTECAVSDPGVFLHLRSTTAPVTSVSYSLDPPGGSEQELIRWYCDGVGPPQERILGRLFPQAPATPAASVTCDGSPCPVTVGEPRRVTISIATDASVDPAERIEITVRRRTT